MSAFDDLADLIDLDILEPAYRRSLRTPLRLRKSRPQDWKYGRHVTIGGRVKQSRRLGQRRVTLPKINLPE